MSCQPPAKFIRFPPSQNVVSQEERWTQARLISWEQPVPCSDPDAPWRRSNNSGLVNICRLSIPRCVGSGACVVSPIGVTRRGPASRRSMNHVDAEDLKCHQHIHVLQPTSCQVSTVQLRFLRKQVRYFSTSACPSVGAFTASVFITHSLISASSDLAKIRGHANLDIRMNQ